MRNIKSATLVFGLVNIPVGVGSAVKEHEIKELHTAHVKCGTALKKPTRCETCGCDVSQDEVKLVYDLPGGKSIDLPAEDLLKVLPTRSPLVSISKTFPLKDLEPELIRKSYYLLPNKNFTAQYKLFGQALSQAKLAALASTFLWGKEYPAAIRADGGVLTLNMLWCYDELVQPGEIADELTNIKVDPQELALAKDILRAIEAPLVDEDLDAPSFRGLQELIKAKIEDSPYETQEQLDKLEPTSDVMAALKASVAEAKRRRKPAAKTPAKPRKKVVA